MINLYKFSVVIALLLSITSFAQVGIGTTTPNGSLEISHNTMGVVLPRVNLTATNVAAPVINPQGGSILEGTMVYNLNTTTGNYSVIPGMYFWNGTHWVSLFERKFTIQDIQTSVLAVDTNIGVHRNIPNLTGKSFVAPYDGTYQFVLTTALGAQEVANKTTNLYSGFDDIDGYGAVGFVEGLFRLKINGTNYDKYNYSASFYRSSTGAGGTGGTDMYLLHNEITIIANVTLTAGSTCTYGATYSANADENIDNFFTGAHQIGQTDAGYETLSEINITYLGRN